MFSRSVNIIVKIYRGVIKHVYVYEVIPYIFLKVKIPLQWEKIVPFFLADIFLYSYEAEFIQSLLSTGRKQLASLFNFTYRYIDDVLSTNNPEFENCLGQMYPVDLEIKDTTESNISASYLDLLLSIGRDGQLHTSIYDKRDDFNFHITQTFRSWVAIFQPRPSLASLFRSLYGMPGLAPRMDVLSWGRRDFQISFSNNKCLYPPAGHVVTGDLTCIPDKGLLSLFKKGPKYRLQSRIDFTKCRDIVDDALQTYCKRWSKKEGVGVHALNDWKMNFYVSLT